MWAPFGVDVAGRRIDRGDVMDRRNRTGSGHDHEQTHRVGRRWRLLLASLVLIAAGGPTAKAAYWNVFNVEGESSATAQIVTYDTLAAC
jgi:hypothetical protein